MNEESEKLIRINAPACDQVDAVQRKRERERDGYSKKVSSKNLFK